MRISATYATSFVFSKILSSVDMTSVIDRTKVILAANLSSPSINTLVAFVLSIIYLNSIISSRSFLIDCLIQNNSSFVKHSLASKLLS
jgi:hypothetical protein